MALGIDIYRYQTVTNWNAVRGHGVSFVYVKGTDGGGPAQVRADAQVRGAHSVGIPVGLYHYAQLNPSPETQADVLTAEVRRLGATGLAPALDLEAPHQPGAAAREFVLRFVARMRNNGFDHVTLYANTNMLNGIGGPSLDDDPNLIIWAAQYGPNDGRRHPLRYGGRANIHQYTSVGIVPGISGRVDLNESLTDLPGGDDVSAEEVWNEEIQVRGQEYKARARDMVMHTNFATWEAVRLLNEQAAKLDLLAGKVDEGDAAILAALRQIPGADPSEWARLLAPVLAPMVKAGATPEQVKEMCDEAVRSAFDRGADAGADGDQ